MNLRITISLLYMVMLLWGSFLYQQGKIDLFFVKNNPVEKVQLQNCTGDVYLKSVTAMNGLGMDTGDILETMPYSYVNISLDGEKTVGLDESSAIEVKYTEESVAVALMTGSLFFHVNAPLEEEENFALFSNHVSASIGESVGIMTYHPQEKTTQISVFSGVVVVTTENVEKKVYPGQMATITLSDDGRETFDVCSIVLNIPYFDYTSYFLQNIRNQLESYKDLETMLKALEEDQTLVHWGDFYKPVIEAATEQFKEFLHSDNADLTNKYAANYFLYDLDDNCTPELFCNSQLGTMEDGYGFLTVYSVDEGVLKEFDPAVYHGYSNDIRTFLLEMPEGNGLYTFSAKITELEFTPIALTYLGMLEGEFISLDVANWSEEQLTTKEKEDLCKELDFPNSLLTPVWFETSNLSGLELEGLAPEQIYEAEVMKYFSYLY